MMNPKSSWRVSKSQAGMRLLGFLKSNLPDALSAKAIKRAIDAKCCTVNARIETFSTYIVKENDLVTFEVAEEKSPPKIPSLYEDEDLLIVNKPPGVVCENNAFKGLFLVHRLDKETSGALILAKTPAMKDAMLALFKERKVKKLYLALVDGIPSQEEGSINKPLAKKGSYQGQTIYGVVSAGGTMAHTLWKRLNCGKTAALVQCEPLTGRTHQLRVHLSWLKHPILGDIQYGKQFRCTYHPKRNLLHAYSISFIHPATGKEIKAIAPIPADFKLAMEALNIK